MSKKFITALFIITLSVFSTAQAADIKNKFINNFSEYLNSTLGQNFETVEVELSSGTTKEVVGSILVVKPLSDIKLKFSIKLKVIMVKKVLIIFFELFFIRLLFNIKN